LLISYVDVVISTVRKILRKRRKKIHFIRSKFAVTFNSTAASAVVDKHFVSLPITCVCQYSMSDVPSTPRIAAHCMVLPPHGFNSRTTVPLPVRTESLITLDVKFCHTAAMVTLLPW